MAKTTRVEARFYDTAAWDAVNCRLCHVQCSIAPSRSGTCGVRTNRDGKLYSDVYGKVSQVHLVDAVRLPLYHEHPNAEWLSVGTKGCNLRCPFCNTFEVSQIGGVRTEPVSPAALVARAEKAKARGISFGVNEPVIAHEFVIDTFKAARASGLRTHVATSGTWAEDPFTEVLAHTDAFTFGIKGFDAARLNNECGGQLEFILKNIEAAIAQGKHVEFTYLPIERDDGWREETAALRDWIAGRDAARPVIILGMEPAFTWKSERSNPDNLRQAHGILAEKVDWVYIAEPGLGAHDTKCRQCGWTLVRRDDNRAYVGPIPGEDKCPQCGAPLPFGNCLVPVAG